ncbi:MAG: RICIN domain-containing protein [Oceanospirillaceae bacterium]|nr:RICIN domain-containing protein [Oceanospirillaceae bacterium]
MIIKNALSQASLSMLLIAGSVNAQTIEISLTDPLDGYLDSYCLSLEGNENDADLTKGLQLHTCSSYQGTASKLQMFDRNELEHNLLYLPKADVCAELTNLTIGSSVTLATCNSTAEQMFDFSGKGHIASTVEPSLCLTASLDTRLSSENFKQQVKGLTLEPCSADKKRFQTWQTRMLK